MNSRPLTYRKAVSAILIATNLLSATQAEAGLWDYLGWSGDSSESVEPAPPTYVVQPPIRSEPAKPARTARPRVKLVDLGDGDDDGVRDDYEKQQVEEKKVKPEDASRIGRGTVDNETPLYSGGDNEARVVGTVKKGETFSVVLAGVSRSRVRFSDGRLGFIDTASVLEQRTKEEAEEVSIPVKKSAPGVKRPAKKVEAPRQPTKKLEADCDDCKAEVKTPKAIDDKKVGGIAEVSKHLNRKQAGGRATNRTRVPDAADEIQGLASGRTKRLATAARRQALMCRVPADYLFRRRGRAKMCGNVSKGKCYAGVKDALVEAGITKTRLPGVSAKDAHYRGYLKKAGMKNIMPSLKGKIGGNLVKIAQNAPAGAVLVYDGGSHGHGHIEIKTTANQYCSDFCRNYPVNIRNARRLIAVYMP
jgi:hypothetical protein